MKNRMSKNSSKRYLYNGIKTKAKYTNTNGIDLKTCYKYKQVSTIFNFIFSS